MVSAAAAVPPLAVPPLGTLGLALPGLVVLDAVNVPAPAGRLSLEFTVPNDSKLEGKSVFWQAALIDRLTPLEGKLTNVISDRISR
jgi:hypothetical protein